MDLGSTLLMCVACGLATYVFALLIWGCVQLAQRRIIPWARAFVAGHERLSVLAASRDERMRLGLRVSCVANGAYGVLQVVLAVAFRSPWFAAMGVYYLVDAAVRGVLIREDDGFRRAHSSGDPAAPQDAAFSRELRTFHRCAWLIGVLDVALAGMAVQMVLDSRQFSYPGYLIYAAAGYTFYSVTMAVVNLVRSRASDRPLMWAVRAFGVCTSLVSALTLQTAMFAAFDDTGGALPQVMNAITALVVCLGLAAVAGGMLKHARGCERSGVTSIEREGVQEDERN